MAEPKQRKLLALGGRGDALRGAEDEESEPARGKPPADENPRTAPASRLSRCSMPETAAKVNEVLYKAPQERSTM